jgi:hypothetical protein
MSVRAWAQNAVDKTLWRSPVDSRWHYQRRGIVSTAWHCAQCSRAREVVCCDEKGVAAFALEGRRTPED